MAISVKPVDVAVIGWGAAGGRVAVLPRYGEQAPAAALGRQRITG